ncbi:MAG: hypothetical protein HY397_01490 [Candidatus Doudnabacteria bacterium]|nr:hypothetical protein [Candidatus Doudnabacteria bacterium]
MENPIFKNRLKQEGNRIEVEVRKRAAGYLVGAFGLVAGLAWNDAIQSFIAQLFPIQKNSVLAKFIYAALLTLAVVLLTRYVISVLEKD